MLDKYRMDAEVTSFDVGPTRQLKYSMILKFLQEAAERQLNQEGLTYEFMSSKGIVFLLTRMDVKISRLPAVGESVAVYTWFETLRGAQFVRDMRMTGAGGETLAEAQSLWITVDPDTHRIIRPTAFPFPDKMRPYKGDTVDVPVAKIKPGDLPEDAWATSFREVRWSDIDCNRHMNNAVYADLICDCYPGGLGNRQLTSFGISFIGEALEGARMEIRSALTQRDEAVYTCKIGDKRCFEAFAVRLQATVDIAG